jgi:large subunit ribosomal protein L25
MEYSVLSNTTQFKFFMNVFQLVGTPRSEYGKKAAKALRQEELVPCNLYGLGENKTFTVVENDVRKLIYTPDTMAVELTIGEEKQMAVVKELQFHPISGRVLHIDFLAVDEKKPVTVSIPVKLEGLAEGVKAGGKLALQARKLKVNGIYTQIPNRVVVDVTSLGLGKKIAVADIQLEGLKLMNPADMCVAEVKATRQSKQA